MKKTNCFLFHTVTVTISLLSATGTQAQSQYDLYIFDKRSGSTKQVTTIANAGEYNVSWSNNGKTIAHDVVFAGGGQTIYLTNIETGVSTPLTGAEGGNDAAWSPDGTKIAFDIWEFNYYVGWIQNIYAVPAAGGAKTLLQPGAHHATWNPRSNKIAFDMYGSIFTKDINTGNETFVTWYGDRPSWSPNGQYIAFDGASWAGGGVWIVEVDTFGYPKSWPVQLTSSGYGPTWSANSKEVIYVDWPNGDPDLYSIPVTGGQSTRIAGRTGGFDKGDYDPACSNNGQYIAWSSYTDEVVPRSAQDKTQASEANVTGIVLQQNYPNPFSASTSIDFELSKSSHIVLSIFSTTGQKIKTLIDADYHSGRYSVLWNGAGEGNRPLATGTYICQLRSGNNVQVKKINLSR